MGVTFCYEKSTHTIRGQRFIYNFKSCTSERSMQSIQALHTETMKHSELKEVHVRGVKGPSILHDLQWFDLCEGFTPDYMHCVLLGVTKMHMELLLEPS